MLRGVDILNSAVKVTLGPKGRNVVLDKSFGAFSPTRRAHALLQRVWMTSPYSWCRLITNRQSNNISSLL
jgi:hypothetical protein